MPVQTRSSHILFHRSLGEAAIQSTIAELFSDPDPDRLEEEEMTEQLGDPSDTEEDERYLAQLELSTSEDPQGVARLTRRSPSGSTSSRAAGQRTSSTDSDPPSSTQSPSATSSAPTLARRLPSPPWVDIPPHPATAHLHDHVAGTNHQPLIVQPRSHPLPPKPSFSLPRNEPRSRTTRAQMPSRITHSVRRVSLPARPSASTTQAINASQRLAGSPFSYASVLNKAANPTRPECHPLPPKPLQSASPATPSGLPAKPALSTSATAPNSRTVRRWTKRKRDKNEEAAVAVTEDYDVAEQKTKAAYEGFPAPKIPAHHVYKKVIGMPAGKSSSECLAGEIRDTQDRLMLYRAYGSRNTPRLNDRVNIAVPRLTSAAPSAEYKRGKAGERGGFEMRTFVVHIPYKKEGKPVMNVYFKNNGTAANQFAEDIQPLTKLVNNIFREKFPGHYKYHEKTLSFVRQRHPDLQMPWGVFSAISVNSGGDVWTKRHRDSKNWATTFCAIVAFGKFDFTKSAFLYCEFNGVVYRIELPPGIPIFIPSALITHWNSKIVGPNEYRGSIVYWLSGALVRYMELNGRKVGDLEGEEKRAYHKGAQARLAKALTLWSDSVD